jgi:poly(3-hydroxybutyrate) depolymerase
MSVEGELDDISGSGQTQAVHDICSGVPKSQQRHFEAKGAGHYGIFSGRRWRELVYPEVKAFILSHNRATPAVAAKKVSKVAVAPAKRAQAAPKNVAVKQVAAKKAVAKRAPAKK